MKSPLHLKYAILCIFVNWTYISCQDAEQQNKTRIVDLHDPRIDANVKSALENGSVSEVVVRKDLLLFPVNAPDLVIAHRQEVHAVPQGSADTNDGKPTSAEVAEINEYTLSKVVSTNDTKNETGFPNAPVAISTSSKSVQNDPVLEPGKLLEIASGFNLSHGLATEKVALPDQVQNFSLPQHSIKEILSKSLSQPPNPQLANAYPPPSHLLFRRSIVNSDEESVSPDDNGDSSAATTEDEESANSDSGVSDEDEEYNPGYSRSSGQGEDDPPVPGYFKRSIAENEEKAIGTEASDVGDSSSLSSSEGSDDARRRKRWIESEDESDDDSNGEGYPDEVNLDKLNVSLKNDNLAQESRLSLDENRSDNGESDDKTGKKRDSEDLDVAEDIVFRPLFRYRQETKLRRRYNARRRNGYWRYWRNSNGYE